MAISKLIWLYITDSKFRPLLNNSIKFLFKIYKHTMYEKVNGKYIEDFSKIQGYSDVRMLEKIYGHLWK